VNNNKNFIFLSNATGGVATFQSNLINYLSKQGIKTILIDKKKNNQTQNKIRIKKNHKLYITNVLRNFNYTFEILKKINKNNIDKNQNIFVISNSIIFTIYFFYIKFYFRNSKILLIYHSHLYDLNFTQIFFGFTSSFLSVFNYKTIFVSNFTKIWWFKYFPLTRLSNFFIFHNLVQLSKKNNYQNVKKLNVGFVGRLDKEKGIEKFLNIAKNIKDKKINFFVYGEGSVEINKKYYKKIKFYKWSNTKTIFSKINLLLVTSKIENSPFSVLEAKSRGIPTVSISDGGIKEIIKHNYDGILLKQYSKLTLIKKSFIKILNKYKFFSKNCIINSKKYDSKYYNFFLNN